MTERTLSLIQPRISLERNRLIDKKKQSICLSSGLFYLRKREVGLIIMVTLRLFCGLKKMFKKDNSHSGKCLYSLTEKGMRTLDIYNVPSGKCLNATAEFKG